MCSYSRYPLAAPTHNMPATGTFPYALVERLMARVTYIAHTLARFSVYALYEGHHLRSLAAGPLLQVEMTEVESLEMYALPAARVSG